MVIRCEISAAVELAWVMDLLVQTARYAEPALDELDRSLAPGMSGMRHQVKDRFAALWPRDRVTGCPELLLAAHAGRCLEDDNARRLVKWLTTLPSTTSPRRALASEPPALRGAIRRRLARLDSDVRLRRAYRDLIVEVWDELRRNWEWRGRGVAARGVAEWKQRISRAGTPAEFVELMPPRHPLSRMDPAAAAALARRRKAITLVPAYFCMSGGLVADLDDRLLVSVPASALEPIRRARDATFVADRSRVLGEPTRVHILIHLMSAPSGVMQITRALGMSQPTVSQHVRVLLSAGLLRAERKAGRAVYFAEFRKAERILRDVSATLARWA